MSAATMGEAAVPARARRAEGGLPLPAVVLLLAGFAVLVCLRMPAIVLKGRFWAEEGHDFFATARRLPFWPALLHPFGGYLNLLANAAALLASRLMPLASAPDLTMAVGLCFQLLPPALLLTARDAWLAPAPVRLAAVLLLLLVPMSEEVALQTLHCQFELTLCCGIILALDAPPGRRAAGRLAALALAPLCGPGAISLVPLFLLRAATERSRARLAQLLALAAGSAIQLLVFSSALAGRGYSLDPLLMLLIVAVRHLAVPLAGPGAGFALFHAIRASLAAGHLPVLAMLAPVLVFGAFASVACREARAVPTRWLLAAAASTAVLSYYGAIDGASRLVQPDCGEHYVFVPQALLGLAVVSLAATASRRVAAGAASLAAWMIAVGAFSYRDTIPVVTDGPSWRAEIAAYRADPRHLPRGWPVSWTVALDR